MKSPFGLFMKMLSLILAVVMSTRHYSEVDNFAVKTKIPEIWPKLNTTRRLLDVCSLTVGCVIRGRLCQNINKISRSRQIRRRTSTLSHSRVGHTRSTHRLPSRSAHGEWLSHGVCGKRWMEWSLPDSLPRIPGPKIPPPPLNTLGFIKKPTGVCLSEVKESCGWGPAWIGFGGYLFVLFRK